MKFSLVPPCGTSVCQMSCLALIVLLCFTTNLVQAAPGAHGPNGEHLDQEIKALRLSGPQFETFSENFELVGKLFGNEVRLFLHDYATNTPIANASIELEANGQSAQASYDELRRRYVIASPALLDILKRPGQHDIVATILTELADDLLVAQLHVPKAATDTRHSHNHAHFPWKTIVKALVVFVIGLGAGFWLKGSKS